MFLYGPLLLPGLARGRALLGLAAVREKVMLLVRRGGAPLTFTVPGAALAAAEPATFEPAAR
ncbi:MAG: hypothetical protein MUE73_08965 [Planctomycetes bacterium]|nr:hypothetical protein [Planctomycetota bacterium]